MMNFTKENFQLSALKNIASYSKSRNIVETNTASSETGSLWGLSAVAAAIALLGTFLWANDVEVLSVEEASPSERRKWFQAVRDATSFWINLHSGSCSCTCTWSS
jgi:hypothetical protein